MDKAEIALKMAYMEEFERLQADTPEGINGKCTMERIHNYAFRMFCAGFFRGIEGSLNMKGVVDD